MLIREAAQQSGVSAPAIRYYEKLGLLGAVKRSPAGYRDFSARDIGLLVFLRKARDLGFTLKECSELLTLVATPQRNNRQMVNRTRELAVSRLQGIDEQIVELERMRALVQLHIDSLGELASTCPVTNKL